MCSVLSTRAYHSDILSQTKPVLNVIPYFHQIHFNNIIQSTPTAPKWSFPFGFLTKPSRKLSSCLWVLPVTSPLISYTKCLVKSRQKLWSSSYSFLQHLVTFTPFDSCYPQHSRSRHPQSMSQARKTAIIELKMVGAIVRFINPVKQASGISAPLLLSASRNISWKILGEEN